MWHTPDNPQIFGRLELDAQPVLDVIERARHDGVHLTATHVVGRAVAHALQAVPELNVHLRGGRAYPRESIDVFFIAAVANGDLSGVKVSAVDRKSLAELAVELGSRAKDVKLGRDPSLGRSKRLMDAIPAPLLRRALRAGAFLTQRFDLPTLGLPRDPFGSAMVSSIGMFGLPEGFAPLAWMYDVPLLLLVGEIAARPVVDHGKVIARSTLPITATIDHRYVDGWHLARAFKAFREYLAAPEAFGRALRASTGMSARSG